MPEECQSEMKVNQEEAVRGLLTAVEPKGIGVVLDCNQYSSFTHLISVTARVLKFCNLLLSRIRPVSDTANTDDRSKAESL